MWRVRRCRCRCCFGPGFAALPKGRAKEKRGSSRGLFKGQGQGQYLKPHSASAAAQRQSMRDRPDLGACPSEGQGDNHQARHSDLLRPRVSAGAVLVLRSSPQRDGSSDGRRALWPAARERSHEMERGEGLVRAAARLQQRTSCHSFPPSVLFVRVCQWLAVMGPWAICVRS